jgi:hypothetical protein
MYRGNATGRGHCRSFRVQFHCVFLNLRTRRELMKRRASAGAGVERARTRCELEK